MGSSGAVRLSSEAELGDLLILPVDCPGALSSAMAGETKDVVLDACTWAAAFSTSGEELGAFSYRIERVEPE